MADIRALGYLPRKTQALGDEYALANRFQNAKDRSLLSESQLAELAELPPFNWREGRTAQRMDTLMAEIRALGHIPRGARRAENALSQRLRYAQRKRQLSESQLAELAEMARSSAEPRRKRLRVLND